MIRKNVVGVYYLILITAMILVLSDGTAMAAVWTDKLDYSPGSVVTISGNNSDNAGYLQGETVNVHVDGPSNYDQSCSRIADSSGAWSCQIILVSDSTAEGSYNYTAVGQISNVTQSGTFTDANPSASIYVTASPAGAIGGTFKITRVQPNGNTQTSGGTTSQSFTAQPGSSFTITTHFPQPEQFNIRCKPTYYIFH